MSDAQWERTEPLLPSNAGRRGHPFGGNRRVVEGIVYRHRTGIPWRDLPRELATGRPRTTPDAVAITYRAACILCVCIAWTRV